MSTHRIFKVADRLQADDGEPVRSVMHATYDAAIVTWTTLAGEGDYRIDAAGQTLRIAAGDVVVAPNGAVQGVLNTGAHAFRSRSAPARSRW